MFQGTSSPVEMRSAVRGWIALDTWRDPFAATFTLKQSVEVPNGTLSHRVWLTEAAASQNFRHFLNQLNRSLFGKAAQRFGRSVRAFPILEGGTGKRLHYHAIIDCPSTALREDFPILMADAWRSTLWGYAQVDVRPNADKGWLSYITKFRDKPDFASSIDWVNVRLT